MTPNPSAPAAADTMNTGWRMISPSGRPVGAALRGAGGANSMNAINAIASSATTASAT